MGFWAIIELDFTLKTWRSRWMVAAGDGYLWETLGTDGELWEEFIADGNEWRSGSRGFGSESSIGFSVGILIFLDKSQVCLIFFWVLNYSYDVHIWSFWINHRWPTSLFVLFISADRNLNYLRLLVLHLRVFPVCGLLLNHFNSLSYFRDSILFFWWIYFLRLWVWRGQSVVPKKKKGIASYTTPLSSYYKWVERMIWGIFYWRLEWLLCTLFYIISSFLIKSYVSQFVKM